MGYDCYVRNPREKRPDVDWSNEASIADYEDWSSRNYFRRNIWGIGHLRDALIEMGMGFDPSPFGVDHPAWPTPQEYGVTDWNDEGEPVGGRAAEFKAAQEKVLAWHGPEIPGIPVHKFCSNDGWHVTKVECQSAIDLYEFAIRDGKAHPEAFGEDFVPFLREAARCDGFEVH